MHRGFYSVDLRMSIFLIMTILGASAAGGTGNKANPAVCDRDERDSASPERPRLAVLTDIGGDPDDQQSMIRLMLYLNELDVRLLVASSAGTLGELKEPITRPDLITDIVKAYGTVLPNLKKHSAGWPEEDVLLSRIVSGNPDRGADHVGAGHDTDASARLIAEIDHASKDDPLNITIWGGQTDFAQALWRVRHDRSSAEFAAFRERFRVYDINDQDRLADWLRKEFPGMFYILASRPEGRDRRDGIYRGMYLTGDISTTSREWVDEHIRSQGPLGALYPVSTWTDPNPHGCLKEGDTPSWFFFLPRGGNVANDPTKPGWGGRFVREDDGWFRDVPFGPDFDPRTEVSRWRPQFQKDFALRMSWCVDEPSLPQKH